MARTTSPELLRTLTFRGLSLAPSQVWGGVRIVPVLRMNCPGDLRLAKNSYDDTATLVSLDQKGTAYMSYVPHGLVVSWSEDGSPVAALGTNMSTASGKSFGGTVNLAHRMARREGKNRLRILPLHLAMEGFLSLHFRGPDVAWREYSADALSCGLGSRYESSVSGRSIRGLQEALRLFEIHQHQVGVLLFVADAFASAFIVSHPDDYRLLHRTLLEDFYGELLYYYALHATSSFMQADLDEHDVHSIADLRVALGRMRGEWAEFQAFMAEGIFDRPLQTERVYRAGPFQLQRFVTDLVPSRDNHIGEAIVNANGTLEYLKTYRLSAAQTRRAYLLEQLAKHKWSLPSTAAALRQSADALVLRLEKAGFGYLLKDHVLRQAQRRR